MEAQRAVIEHGNAGVHEIIGTFDLGDARNPYQRAEISSVIHDNPAIFAARALGRAFFPGEAGVRLVHGAQQQVVVIKIVANQRKRVFDGFDDAKTRKLMVIFKGLSGKLDKNTGKLDKNKENSIKTSRNNKILDDFHQNPGLFPFDNHRFPQQSGHASQHRAHRAVIAGRRYRGVPTGPVIRRRGGLVLEKCGKQREKRFQRGIPQRRRHCRSFL